MQATFAKPLDAELELNVVTKSNDQTGRVLRSELHGIMYLVVEKLERETERLL